MSQWQQKRFGRPKPHQQPRRPPVRKPKGPAAAAPKLPVTGKQRKQMSHAALWRLSRLIHKPVIDIKRAADPVALVVEMTRANKIQLDKRADARRLAIKIKRLRLGRSAANS